MTTLRIALPAPGRGRVAALDELKGVAILLVMLYHAEGVLYLPNRSHGDAGVDIFVIVSGLALALGARAEGAGRFLARRFLRIYPAYWIVLTVILWARARVFNEHFSGADIGLHYLGIQGWFGDVEAIAISDPFWFITLIVSLYLLYLPLRPLLGRPDRLLLVGAVVALVPTIIFFRTGQLREFNHLGLRIPGFFLGLVLGRLARDGELGLPLSPALGLAAFTFFFVPYLFNFIFSTTYLGIGFIALYLGLRPFLSAGTARVLSFLGDHSYEIYLVHQPLMRECNYYVLYTRFPGTNTNPAAVLAGMLVAAGVALLVAVLLHRLVRPLASLVPRAPVAA